MKRRLWIAIVSFRLLDEEDAGQEAEEADDHYTENRVQTHQETEGKQVHRFVAVVMVAGAEARLVLLEDPEGAWENLRFDC